MHLLSICFATIALFYGAQGACHSPPSFGPPNMYEIVNGTEIMELLSTTQNGKLYNVTVPHNGGNTQSWYTVVHVWGTPYQMGYAQGALLKDSASEFISTVWGYLEGQVDQFLGDLPVWLQNMIATFGLDAALDLTYYATLDYTPAHFYQEMQGISDASGIDYNTLVRVHMIAGLTQGACSAFGAWGQALANPNKALQLRALDWNMDGPFRNFPSMTVYHPNSGDGHAFVNIGLQGFIGGLTGMSSAQLGISEIGVGYPDSTFGSESRIGIPFIFLLREILQYDQTLDDAINRMANARRTCDLILGVGDGKMNLFRGMEYSYSVLDVMDDTNLRPANDTWHPKIPDVVYWGMDWDCPSYNYVLSQQIKKYYGQITPELAIRYFTAVEMSGDNHLAYYDLTDSQFYVSFAAQEYVSGPTPAYARQFTRWDANALFNEQPPSY